MKNIKYFFKGLTRLKPLKWYILIGAAFWLPWIVTCLMISLLIFYVTYPIRWFNEKASRFNYDVKNDLAEVSKLIIQLGKKKN